MEAKNPSIVHVTGIIVQITKKTIRLMTKDNKLKRKSPYDTTRRLLTPPVLPKHPDTIFQLQCPFESPNPIQCRVP